MDMLLVRLGVYARKGHTMQLITADVGNVNLKYRKGRMFELEPSLVRLAPAHQGYNLTNEEPVRPFTYLSGPADLQPIPYLIGEDAERGGMGDMSLVGSASIRANSDAYILLHLYTIVASLDDDATEAEVLFAGGLPVEDSLSNTVGNLLKAKLKGTHAIRWGDTEYSVTITGMMFVPQPIGAIATLMFHHDGSVISNGLLNKLRFVLDIGGGTTDFVARQGLRALPGCEGGIRLGIQNAASIARDFIQQRHPELKHLDTSQVLAQMRRARPVIYMSGEPVSIADEISVATTQVADQILAVTLPRWETRLAEGEILICGGGGEEMYEPIYRALSGITKVEMLSDPLFRVVDGIGRLARRQQQRPA